MSLHGVETIAMFLFHHAAAVMRHKGEFCSQSKERNKIEEDEELKVHRIFSVDQLCL